MAYGEFAKIYDELINEDINYDSMVVRLKELIDKYQSNPVDYLDLACGTGNIGVRMAKYFKSTYAVDLSEDMLREAFDKFKAERIKAKIICQDMRELSLNHKFDVITCVLDSTNYLIEDGDLEKYFSGVYEHLKDGGLFIFDINSFYKLTNILGNNIYTYSSEDVFYTWENTIEDNVVNMFLTFFVKEKNELYERFEEEHFERAYEESEIEEVLKQVGFTLLGKFDGYNRDEVQQESERILYVVGKNMEDSMKDKIIRATAKDGMVRIIGGITTTMVNDGTSVHECTPLASAALGRMLTAAALMGRTLKSDDEVVTIKINGGGIAKGVTVTGYQNASVKGFIGNPYIELPLNSKGKLDVGGAIGKDGLLYVIKDLGLKEPYVGQVPIQTGEIAEDLTYYFTVSEQTPSAVSLGVLVDKDYSIKAAGGFVIQMMPGADPLLADLLMYRLEEIPSITTMISEGKTIEEILEFIFDGMDLKILDEVEPKYVCDCSRERIEKALISIGEKDLREIYEEGKEEEVVCHFCNRKYKFTNEDIKDLLDKATRLWQYRKFIFYSTAGLYKNIAA